jgi:hypothetical protein
MSEGDALSPPGRVSAKGLSGAVNRIEFSGGDDTSYEIWRRHGDTVDWYLHATTSDTNFADSDVKPGQYYEYKVRTVRGDSVSDFSPSAVAYGAE